jgi:hypothetical protein
MELIHSFASITFYLKLSFILVLFLINLYLIFSYNPNLNNKILQSGLGNKNLKTYLSALGAAGGLLSSYITVKNEFKDYQIGRINQLKVEENAIINRSIDKDKEIHQKILTTISNYREDLLRLHHERAKIIGHTGRLSDLHEKIKDNVLIYKNKSTDLNSKLSELGIIDQLINRDLEKFSEEVNSLISNIEEEELPSKSEVNSLISNIEEEEIPSKSDNDINESSIINTDFFAIKEWFDGLIGIKKIAFSLILGKSVILSALVSIIFIFYGNILIEKYDLVNRYPKLAKFIELRKKYQKYYFIIYCLLIFFIIIIEVIFGIAILLL